MRPLAIGGQAAYSVSSRKFEWCTRRGAGLSSRLLSVRGSICFPDMAVLAEGKRYLAQILISGMIGPIDTEGHQFNGMMPSFRADLSDTEIGSQLPRVSPWP